MRDRILVFGASSSTGRVLLSKLGEPVWAVTRDAVPDDPAASPVRWVRGGLDAFTLPAPGYAGRIASLGPLPEFVTWLARQSWQPQRVVALSSASVLHKAESPAVAERALAQRLRHAETRLATLAAVAGFECTVLRPTMIWGGGRCALSRLARLARRWRWLPRPWAEGGLRTPLHHRDLAAAVAVLLEHPPGVKLDSPTLLSGPETLRIGALVQRVAQSVGARCLRVPAALLAAGQGLARHAGLAFGEGMMSRWSQQQAVDSRAFWSSLALVPRGFDPQTADWEMVA